MKKSILIALVVLLSSSTFAQKKAIMKTQKDSLSYAFGILMAENIKKDGIEISTEIFTKSFSAHSNDATDLKMNVQEANALVQEFFTKKQEAEKAIRMKDGIEFLAKNGKKEGVTTTASGLQYEVITAGTGAAPSSTDKVTVHYTGTLLDGKVFDSSVQRGEPATFGVNQVIPGWTEALQLMKEGDKWKLFIPSELAYGSRGAGGSIGPDETLIFEVELIKVN